MGCQTSRKWISERSGHSGPGGATGREKEDVRFYFSLLFFVAARSPCDQRKKRPQGSKREKGEKKKPRKSSVQKSDAPLDKPKAWRRKP